MVIVFVKTQCVAGNYMQPREELCNLSAACELESG
jgi:hypothetical protein